MFSLEQLVKIGLEIVRGYELDPHGTHGIRHWGRVLDNAAGLAALTGANVRVAQLFALFHDSRRVDEYSDPEHGLRGAALAEAMNGGLFQLDPVEPALLKEACATHTGGRGPADITIHACWDADRLDLPRVGTDTRIDWLCTAAAREDSFHRIAASRGELNEASEFSSAMEQLLSQ
jgi:uncharacterized protein